MKLPLTEKMLLSTILIAAFSMLMIFACATKKKCETECMIDRWGIPVCEEICK